MSTQTKSNEIALTRVFKAPLRAVWDARTDPKQVEQWWGPRGFTLTTHSKDLRAGGHWHYTMHGPDGANYVNKTKYLEVEPLRKLVYDHGGNDERKPLFRVTVLFSETKGGTKMEMTMACPTPEDAAQTRGFIRKAGGEATWDRLAEHLDARTAGKETFVINRSFDAPIDTVFAMWTDPKHVARWLPPAGFRMAYRRADIRPGGHAFFSMTAENGSLTMHGRMDYLAIEPPHTIVYTQDFRDEQENPSRHPLLPTWPPAMRTTVTFAEETPERTRVTVTWEPAENANADEIAAFKQHRPSMTQGWTGSFDKLERCIGTRSPAG